MPIGAGDSFNLLDGVRIEVDYYSHRVTRCIRISGIEFNDANVSRHEPFPDVGAVVDGCWFPTRTLNGRIADVPADGRVKSLFSIGDAHETVFCIGRVIAKVAAAGDIDVVFFIGKYHVFQIGPCGEAETAFLLRDNLNHLVGFRVNNGYVYLPVVFVGHPVRTILDEREVVQAIAQDATAGVGGFVAMGVRSEVNFADFGKAFGICDGDDAEEEVGDVELLGCHLGQVYRVGAWGDGEFADLRESPVAVGVLCDGLLPTGSKLRENVNVVANNGERGTKAYLYAIAVVVFSLEVVNES